MPLNANKVKYEGGSRQALLEGGVYPGRLVQLIDYGLQPQRPFKGQEKPPAYQIGLTYELSDEFMVDEDGNEMEDKPRWISEIVSLYSLQSERAKSTLRYLALDPNQDFEGDFTKLLGLPCNISIIVSEGAKGERNYVAGISTMRPKDAAKLPELVNEPRLFSLDDPDLETFNSFPDWIKEKIVSNLEFKGSALEALLKDAPKEEKREDKPKKAKKNRQPVEEEAFDADDDDDAPY